MNQLRIIREITRQINYSLSDPSYSVIEEFQGFRGESFTETSFPLIRKDIASFKTRGFAFSQTSGQSFEIFSNFPRN